jgi:hypothetical protein
MKYKYQLNKHTSDKKMHILYKLIYHILSSYTKIIVEKKLLYHKWHKIIWTKIYNTWHLLFKWWIWTCILPIGCSSRYFPSSRIDFKNLTLASFTGRNIYRKGNCFLRFSTKCFSRYSRLWRQLMFGVFIPYHIYVIFPLNYGTFKVHFVLLIC